MWAVEVVLRWNPRVRVGLGFQPYVSTKSRQNQVRPLSPNWDILVLNGSISSSRGRWVLLDVFFCLPWFSEFELISLQRDFKWCVSAVHVLIGTLMIVRVRDHMDIIINVEISSNSCSSGNAAFSISLFNLINLHKNWFSPVFLLSDDILACSQF